MAVNRPYTKRKARSAIHKVIPKEAFGKMVEMEATELLLTTPDLSPEDAVKMANDWLKTVNKRLKRSINSTHWPYGEFVRRRIEREIAFSTLLDVCGGIDETREYHT